MGYSNSPLVVGTVFSIHLLTVLNLSISILLTIALPSIAFLTCFFAIPAYLELIRNIERASIKVWIIEVRGEICGYLSFKESEEYTHVTRLLIGSNHRNNGIGSYLISYCVHNTIDPIYLACRNTLSSFYHRRGFIDADYADVPAELLVWRDRRDYNLMIFTQGN